MPHRIVLVHPYGPSMQPIVAAFASGWPDAEVLNILDETLYADVTPEGVMDPSVPRRVGSLLRQAEASRAEAIVFTGSTFGPAVEIGRAGIRVPVLKADEAMVELAVRKGGLILLVCTARRAAPVIEANIHTAAEAIGKKLELKTLVVPEAKEAIIRGDAETHDRLIAEAIADFNTPDTLLLGQVSMARVADLLPKALAAAVVTSSAATVKWLRGHFEG